MWPSSNIAPSPSDFTSTIDLASFLDMVQEPRENEKVVNNHTHPRLEVVSRDVVAAPEFLEPEPVCIDLDEDDKVYRYFC